MSDKKPPQPKAKDAFGRTLITLDDRIRSRDNTDAVPQPPRGAQGLPDLAPGGSLGVKRNLVPQQAPVTPQRPSAGLSLNHDPDDQSHWIEGRIITMPGYSFHAKMYDEPSQFGIEGGMISKLDVRKDDQLVMRYDRGWARDPETAEHVEALHRIRNGLGDVPKDQDKPKDHDQIQDRAKGWDFER